MKKMIAVILILISTGIYAQSKQEKQKLAQVMAQKIVQKIIKPSYTDFEKILILHEYITDRVTYGKLNGETSAYTALFHDQADCVGFARSLDTLYKAAGLDSFVVVRKKGHLWVKVKIHGHYYNIDPTWSALKSNWRQYSWFLLSDAQNVDEDKGITHILDSGENYPAAGREFVLQEKDYSHKKALRSKKKLRILGTVSLPDGQKAPQGGIRGAVNGNRFLIPLGQSSVFFMASLDREEKGRPVLKYTLVSGENTKSYAKEGFYHPEGTVIGLHSGHDFDLTPLDVTGVKINLIPAKHSISGKISLPPGEKAPKGGLVFSMELTTYHGKTRIRYYDRAFIPENENSGIYRIDIPESDKDLEFYLYYFNSNLEKWGFEKVGYYNKAETSTNTKRSLFRIENGLLDNADLTVLKKAQ